MTIDPRRRFQALTGHRQLDSDTKPVSVSVEVTLVAMSGTPRLVHEGIVMPIKRKGRPTMTPSLYRVAINRLELSRKHERGWVETTARIVARTTAPNSTGSR